MRTQTPGSIGPEDTALLARGLEAAPKGLSKAFKAASEGASKGTLPLGRAFEGVCMQRDGFALPQPAGGSGHVQPDDAVTTVRNARLLKALDPESIARRRSETHFRLCTPAYPKWQHATRRPLLTDEVAISSLRFRVIFYIVNHYQWHGAFVLPGPHEQQSRSPNSLIKSLCLLPKPHPGKSKGHRSCQGLSLHLSEIPE